MVFKMASSTGNNCCTCTSHYCIVGGIFGRCKPPTGHRDIPLFRFFEESKEEFLMTGCCAAKILNAEKAG